MTANLSLHEATARTFKAMRRADSNEVVISGLHGIYDRYLGSMSQDEYRKSAFDVLRKGVEVGGTIRANALQRGDGAAARSVGYIIQEMNLHLQESGASQAIA